MKKIKVFGYPWHVGHQFELMKMDFIESYDLLVNPYRKWGTKSRPLPDKANWVLHYEPGKYDLIIMHTDQQTINERFTKKLLFTQVDEVIDDTPVVVINHMTPYHDEFSKAETIKRVKELVGDKQMVVNSMKAREQWGWGHFIRHGMTPEEWHNNKKEPRATCFVSPAGMERAYKREFLREVIYYLKEWGLKFFWIGVDVSFKNFQEYRDWLSRSLIYFNPTWQSPMPRSRTEAMLSGCCIVTTPYHDADKWIEHGKNGFLVNDEPQQTASLIADLMTDRADEALKIGQKGREFAQDYFHHDNFTRQWRELLEEMGVL